MLLQVLGIILIIALAAALLVRPSSILPIFVAVGIVAASIIVTWNQIETYQAQRVTSPVPAPSASVTSPGSPRAGS